MVDNDAVAVVAVEDFVSEEVDEHGSWDFAVVSVVANTCLRSLKPL